LLSELLLHAKLFLRDTAKKENAKAASKQHFSFIFSALLSFNTPHYGFNIQV
jgi:hypothetical protein